MRERFLRSRLSIRGCLAEIRVFDLVAVIRAIRCSACSPERVADGMELNAGWRKLVAGRQKSPAALENEPLTGPYRSITGTNALLTRQGTYLTGIWTLLTGMNSHLTGTRESLTEKLRPLCDQFEALTVRYVVIESADTLASMSNEPITRTSERIPAKKTSRAWIQEALDDQ